MSKTVRSFVLALCATGALCTLGAAPAGALKVTWMRGYRAPGTPARYDRVGVIEVGPRTARNVLILEPGTSSGATYFVPLAEWVVAHAKGWQVWSVERRENLLEDQSVLNLAKRGRVGVRRLFDYYLGYLVDPSVTHHFHPVDSARFGFAKDWGMAVAVGDLRRVIAAARRRGGKIVLGGHSLGGGVVTGYATWDFHGRPGADQLAGLVYDDGSSFGAAESPQQAQADLAALRAGTPWLSFGGIPAPLAGTYSSVGALSALLAPDARSLGQRSGLLSGITFADGRSLTPREPVTNLGQYGYALNVATSPAALVAAQAHLGRGISARGPVHGWDSAGALTPIKRMATMFAGPGILSSDGTEWYFPHRLTYDTHAVGNGLANPAARILGLHSTLGRRLPRRLRILAFAASLGSTRVIEATRALMRQSHIPSAHVTVIDRHRTYAHNDPAGAYPRNVFFRHLVSFLRDLAPGG